MRKAEYWKDELQGAFYVAGLFLFGASILVALAAAFIFFVQGCVPSLLATGDKAAEHYIEKIGKDPGEYRLGGKEIEGFKEELQRQKDGDDNDQNENAKNIEQDSAGFEGA